MIKFQLELANQLISGLSSRMCLGHPWSGEHVQLTHLQPSHNHWPVHSTRKNNCVVCAGRARKLHLPSRGNVHETRVKCKDCDVYLCVAPGRDCFERYYSQVDYC